MILLWVLIGLILLFIAIIMIRTLTFSTPEISLQESPLLVEEGMPDVIAKLSEAIRYQTIIASEYHQTDFKPFEEFRLFLQRAFPLCHTAMTLTTINTHSMLFHWKGSDASKQPILFLAHYDVVPAEKETLSNWTYPPFEGKVTDKAVHGRGTLDDKNELIAILQCIEELIAENFTPARDIYFAFGHDEEVGGEEGAKQIAAYLKNNGITFEAVFDEGGVVITDAIKGVQHPMAVIGLAEKGFNNFKITTVSAGGHSSTPPSHTALGNMSAFISRLENNPMRPRLTPIVQDLLSNVAEEMGFAVKMAVANLWLFRPLLFRILSSNPTMNAMIRTTFAATMAKGSDAPNVLPQKAEFVINCRVLPGDTPQSAIDHMKHTAGDTKITIEPLLLEQPSPISRTDTPGWEKLLKTIHEVYPNAIPTPYLMLGGTDARKYYDVCDSIYRFVPVLLSNNEKDTIHAANESISIENLKRMVIFYKELIGMYDR